MKRGVRPASGGRALYHDGPRVMLVHRRPDALGEDARDVLATCRNHALYGLVLVGGKVGEYPAGGVLGAGTRVRVAADAHAQAGELAAAELLVDRPEAVVTAVAAAVLEPHRAERQ